MRKILFALVALMLTACFVVPASASGGCHKNEILAPDGCWVPMSESYPPTCQSTTTVVTTTTTTTTICEPICPPPPCPPRPALCYDPYECAIKDALKDIIRVGKDAKCLLERELMNSDWKLTSWKRPKCVKADKTGRIIRYAAFKNNATGATCAYFFVIRTSETICNYAGNGYRNYGSMFVTNFNAPGSRDAAVYEDEWLVTDYSQPIGRTIVDFVEMLEAGELAEGVEG